MHCERYCVCNSLTHWCLYSQTFKFMIFDMFLFQCITAIHLVVMHFGCALQYLFVHGMCFLSVATFGAQVKRCYFQLLSASLKYSMYCIKSSKTAEDCQMFVISPHCSSCCLFKVTQTMQFISDYTTHNCKNGLLVDTHMPMFTFVYHGANETWNSTKKCIRAPTPSQNKELKCDIPNIKQLTFKTLPYQLITRGKRFIRS